MRNADRPLPLESILDRADRARDEVKYIAPPRWRPGEGVNLAAWRARTLDHMPGSVRCPECKRSYVPDLPRGKGEPYQREQHITGLCSDACWTAYVGGES